MGNRNDEKITTSAIVGVNGREITVMSGNIYILGRVSPKYRSWLKSEGRSYNSKQPIKFIKDED